jgi:hypothetical protein
MYLIDIWKYMFAELNEHRLSRASGGITITIEVIEVIEVICSRGENHLNT